MVWDPMLHHHQIDNDIERIYGPWSDVRKPFVCKVELPDDLYEELQDVVRSGGYKQGVEDLVHELIREGLAKR